MTAAERHANGELLELRGKAESKIFPFAFPPGKTAVTYMMQAPWIPRVRLSSMISHNCLTYIDSSSYALDYSARRPSHPVALPRTVAPSA